MTDLRSCSRLRDLRRWPGLGPVSLEIGARDQEPMRHLIFVLDDSDGTVSDRPHGSMNEPIPVVLTANPLQAITLQPAFPKPLPHPCSHPLLIIHQTFICPPPSCFRSLTHNFRFFFCPRVCALIHSHFSPADSLLNYSPSLS